MIKHYPYLNDKKFLDDFFHIRVKTTFARITALNWDEEPIEEIQGKVVTANFNLDGNSSMRRTGSLSVYIENFDGLSNINSVYSINKKVFVEIGIKNTTIYYMDYPILWFPIGLFVLNGVSLTHDVSNLTLNMQLKDKMCLLNGECGGRIPAATVFDNIDTINEKGQPTISRPIIIQIIQELVNHFGGEPLNKIIISDIDSKVKQVMKWLGSSPLYMVQKNGQYQITINANQYQNWLNQGWVDVEGSPFEYGHDVGFIYTDFSYPGQLICNAGAAVTQVLDQIISVLGNYEYFYDIYGFFHFQEIKNYLNNAQSKYILDKINSTGNLDAEDYFFDPSYGKAVYRFENSDLITSFSNSPQYTNIKNDFIVWGERSGSDNIKRIIRYHLAIDKKPKVGNTYRAFQYTDPEDGLQKWTCPLIYDSIMDVPKVGVPGVFYYDSDHDIIYTWNKNEKGKFDYMQTNYVLQYVTTKDWRTELYFQGIMAEPYGTDSNYYYTELKNEWPKIYNIVPDSEIGVNDSGFKPQVLQNFDSIDYFLDFIDTTSNVKQFSVENIGRRSQVDNSNEVNCIFEPKIPDIVLIERSSSEDSDTEMYEIREECIKKGQNFYQVPDNIYSLLSAGGNFNSAYNSIRQTLHQYVSYNENVSIACIPLYFLQPNTRIFIRDDASSIYGDYMINSISIGLDTGATMNINATRALEKI